MERRSVELYSFYNDILSAELSIQHPISKQSKAYIRGGEFGDSAFFYAFPNVITTSIVGSQMLKSLNMKNKWFLMALVAAISFSSCGSKNGTEGIDEKRITINDVQISTEEGKILNGAEPPKYGWPHHGSTVLYKGKPFSGKVWSKDGKTAATEVYSGFPVLFIGYYDNGNVAVVMTGDIDGPVVLYNEDGSFKDHISIRESWDNPLCDKYMELLEKENLIETFWDM